MMNGFAQTIEVGKTSNNTLTKGTPFIGSHVVQKKLTIGSENDPMEAEADRIADQVVNTKEFSSPPSPPSKANLAQRKCSACKHDEELQKKPLAEGISTLIQRVPLISGGESVGTNQISQKIQSTKGGGSLMGESTRNFMENRFGTDFSQVKIHTDSTAIQLSRDLQAQAFTVGNDVYFNEGKYNPSSTSGKHLLAHELTHTLQQKSINTGIQRRLLVHPTHHPDLDPADPAAALTQAQRFSMMDTLVQGLCQDFQVDATGEVIDKTMTSRPSSEYSSSTSPVGCCCLALMTQSSNVWKVVVSELDGPHTRPTSKLVVMTSSRVPIEFGAHTASNDLAFQGEIPAFGHELCGHAVLMEINAHPPLRDRTTSDVHDPTVRIENLISTEQGVPASELRGLARSGSHRGESVDKITIRNYPTGGTTTSSLPASEQSKIQFAANYIIQNNSFVDVIGHTDSSGSNTVNDQISLDRANDVKRELRTLRVPDTITKFSLVGVDRIIVDGVRDRFPPDPPLNASNANWRRVELLIAGFPAGAQHRVPGTPTGVTSVPRPANVPRLARSSDSCVSLLVRGAYGIP